MSSRTELVRIRRVAKAVDHEKIFVVAGAQIEAIRFMQSRSINWRHIVLINSCRAFDGYHPRMVYLVGTFEQHPNWQEIDREITRRCGLAREVVR